MSVHSPRVDEFAAFVLFGGLVVVAIFLAIGRWYPGSGAEQVDWRPTRSPEVEAELELDDVDQMIEAQNRSAGARPGARRSPRPTCAPRWRPTSAGARSCGAEPGPSGPRRLGGARPDRGVRLPRAARSARRSTGTRFAAPSRSAEGLAALRTAGIEGVVADPDRLGTLLPALSGVTVVCWLMGTATGSPEVHGARLQTLVEHLVDTPVRGLVYEAAGSVDASLLEQGASDRAHRVSSTWHIPSEVVTEDPAEHAAWLAAMKEAVERLLG